MSQPTQTREVALDHRTQAQAFTDAAALVAGQLWDEVNPDRIVDSWAAQVPELNAVVSGAQLGTARLADSYVTDALEVQDDLSGEAVAPINPAGFSGQASDGRGLLSLLASPAFITVATIADGVDVLRAMQFGRASLDTIVRTQVADAGRLADQTSLTAHPSATGYVRQTDGNPCARCLVLAGQVYEWNRGFKRHPRCGCTHVPTLISHPRWLDMDPRRLYDSMTRSQRLRAGFTLADQRALDEGADIFQIVNARHRPNALRTAAGARPGPGGRAAFTTEGTTRLGLAGQRLGRGTPRMTPDQIFASAGTREEALQLLYRNGYLLQPDPRMFATLRGLPEPDLSRLTVADLKALARDRGVVGYSKMRKPELLDVLGSPAPVKAAAKAVKAAPAKKATVRTQPAQFERRAAAATTGDDVLRAAPVRLADSRPTDPRDRAIYDALRQYDRGSTPMLRVLRDDPTISTNWGHRFSAEQAREYVRAIDEAMAASRLTQDVVVWRGLGTGRSIFGPRLSDDLAGFEWTDVGFVSTSPHSGLGSAVRGAAEFAEDQGVLLRVLTPQGTGAVRISRPGGEGVSELLLDRGQRFRVVRDRGVSTELVGGTVPRQIRILDVEIIPAAPAKAAAKKATKAAPVKKAAKVAPVRLMTPAQAARELSGPDAWAQAAREGRVTARTAGARIREFAQGEADSAAIVRAFERQRSPITGIVSRLDDEQLARVRRYDAEANRLRTLADEIDPPRPAKAVKAAPAKKAATPDLIGARGLSDVPAVRAVQIDNRIRQAWTEQPKPPAGGWVGLAELRGHALLRDVPRTEVDAALERFALRPGVRLATNENTKSLDLADIDAALRLGDSDRHMLALDRNDIPSSALAPLPAAPAKAAKKATKAAAKKAAKKAAPVKKVTGPPAPSRMTGPALRAELERAGVTVPARLSKATLADEVTALRGGAPAREISERLSPPPAVPGAVGPQAARLPKVADPTDVRAQARATNPRNGKAYEGPVTPEIEAAGVSYSVNCTRVVIAHEMRRRGLDVTAGATTLTGDTIAAYVRAFRLNGRYATRVADDLSRSMSARQVADEAASWPRGARGIVTMDGHTLMVERDRLTGKVMFVDAQNPTRSGPMSLAEFERRARARGASTTQRMAVARVDDLDMSDYALRYVESPGLDVADGQVGKTAFPQDPGSETFTQFDEMAALPADDRYP